MIFPQGHSVCLRSPVVRASDSHAGDPGSTLGGDRHMAAMLQMCICLAIKGLFARHELLKSTVNGYLAPVSKFTAESYQMPCLNIWEVTVLHGGQNLP